MALLTVAEVHQMTGWARNTIYAYTDAGRITMQTDATGRKGYDQADALRVFPPKVRTVRTSKIDRPMTSQNTVQKVNDRDLLLAEKDLRIADLKELVTAKDLTISDLRSRLEYKPAETMSPNIPVSSHHIEKTTSIPYANPARYWVVGALVFAVLVLTYAAYIARLWYWNGGIVIV